MDLPRDKPWSGKPDGRLLWRALTRACCFRRGLTKYGLHETVYHTYNKRRTSSPKVVETRIAIQSTKSIYSLTGKHHRIVPTNQKGTLH